MQDVIRLLPDKVANQIAAGEVVQRPSSVVKELLENAIDAGAKSIQLIVKEAGKNLIQVIDDGVGMSQTDARMAFERHSTSKIRTTEDIFSIQTKGFRGEALASISAVAQVELKTKTEAEDIGTKIIIEGNEVLSQSAEITSDGSNFLVKNLFFNVPARRKFLKSNHVEMRHIVDEFLRVALAHPDVKLQLVHNDKELYLLKAQNKAQRIVDVFGKKIRDNLVPVSEDLGWIAIEGYIGKAESAKKTRGEQFFFVNNRFFRSAYLNRAVLDAYDGLLPNGYTPAYFLYFTIDPEKIDVNIHPSKTEIKFEKESDLYALLRATIKQSLGVYHLAPSLDFDQDPQWSGTLLNPQEKKQLQAPKIKIDPNYNPFHRPTVQRPSSAEKVAIDELYHSSLSKPQKQEALQGLERAEQPSRLSSGHWLLEQEGAIIVFHPFRVHQSILFEKFHIQPHKNNLSQQLLFPIEFPIDARQKVVLDSIKEPLFELGFEWDDSTEFLSITAIPQHLISENIMALFDALLEEAQWHSGEKFYPFFHQKAAFVSAKNRNHWQSIDEVISLWGEFQSIGAPKYSPSQKLNYHHLDLDEVIKPLEL